MTQLIAPLGRRAAALCLAAFVLPSPPVAASQQPQRSTVAPAPAPVPPEGAALSAGQIQRWFEAFTVLQAQEALQLSEAQYGRFVTRLKALQEVRRKHQQTRNRIIADMRSLTAPQVTAEESQIADRLKALREEDERGAAELKKTLDAVDETLDVRQQARFRIFEERMEQQKLELLMRARQNARAAGRARGRTDR